MSALVEITLADARRWSAVVAATLLPGGPWIWISAVPRVSSRTRRLMSGMLLVLALAACAAGPRVREIELVGRNLRFTPDTITVTRGDTVRLNFGNPDSVPHLIDLPAFNQHIALPPGGNFTLEFVADRAGSFTFVCSVPGHQEAGMVGTFVVEPAP